VATARPVGRRCAKLYAIGATLPIQAADLPARVAQWIAGGETYEVEFKGCYGASRRRESSSYPENAGDRNMSDQPDEARKETALAAWLSRTASPGRPFVT
jgi:hypothetical protein